MKYLTLLQLRDQTIEDKFLAILPGNEEMKEEYRDRLESAVRAANEDLPRQLRILLGPEQADKIMKDIEREAI